MCTPLIVDADRFHAYLGKEAGLHLRRWMEEGHGIVVYTAVGKYGRELKRDASMYRIVGEYSRAGVAKKIGGVAIEKASKSLRDYGRRLVSNDRHVLELAVAANVILLYSGDKPLHKDFKELPNVGSQRRSIYPHRSDNRTREQFLHQRRCPNR